ncbi:MAG: hypothetical protein ACOVOV_16710, partial [Dolichospermum sp.]
STTTLGITGTTEYSWSSPSVGAANKTSLHFDVLGRMNLRVGTGFLAIFGTQSITANRNFNFPDVTTTLAGWAVPVNNFTGRITMGATQGAGVASGTALLCFPDNGTTANEGIQFGSDNANLYRNAPNTLKTDAFLIQSAPTLTGSSTTSALNLSQTLNTTGAPDIINLSVTNTASSTATNLINCKVDNVSAFSVSRTGSTRIGLVSGNNWTFSSNQLISSQNAFISAAGSVGVVLSSSALVGGVLANASGGKVCDTGVSTAITASAVLEVVSTSKGFLPPRMTSAQRLAISSPATGLIVYQTDATEGLYIRKSTGWVFII